MSLGSVTWGVSLGEFHLWSVTCGVSLVECHLWSVTCGVSLGGSVTGDDSVTGTVSLVTGDTASLVTGWVVTGDTALPCVNHWCESLV